MDTKKLKGIAIVSMAEGMKLGEVDTLLFDHASLQLRAFQVKGDSQPFIVPLDLVQTIGADAIMVESRAASRIASKDGEFGSLVEVCALQQLKVVDATGTLVMSVKETRRSGGWAARTFVLASCTRCRSYERRAA